MPVRIYKTPSRNYVVHKVDVNLAVYDVFFTNEDEFDAKERAIVGVDNETPRNPVYRTSRSTAKLAVALGRQGVFLRSDDAATNRVVQSALNEVGIATA